MSSVLEIDRFLRQGIFWREWLASFGSVQGLTLVEHSAVMLPVAGLFQVLLGPSFQLIAIIGCFCGAASILLAWLVGRRFSDGATALFFAALVTVSPLQIAWSRIGGLYISVVPHLLLALWVSHTCGRSGSVWFGILAGALSWMSLYNNYQTRVLLLVVPLAVASTARQHAHTWPRTIALLLAVALPQVLAFLLLNSRGVVDALWPKFGAYGTNPDTVRDLASLVTHCAGALPVQAPRVLRQIVYADRIDPWSSSYGWGLEYGGIYPAVTLMLGFIGLTVMVTDYRHQAVWLALLALGFLVPALSGAEERRLLIFDVAWNFAAARGLAAILGSKRVASTSREAVSVSLATLFASLGLWALMAIFRLSTFTSDEFTAIPFGTGTNGDGFFCRPCRAMAHEWQEHVARNETVVVANSHLGLDGALHPGSLFNFGLLAALSAGRPDGVVDFYFALESAGAPNAVATNPVARLRSAIHGTRPDKVVWYFKSPTAWEEELIASLERFGGVVEDISYPYSAHEEGRYSPYIKTVNRRVEADPGVSDAFLGNLEQQLLGKALNERRVRLALVDKRPLRSVPLALTSSMARRGTAPTDASVPQWTALVPDGYVAPDRYTSDRAVNECSGIRAIAEVTDGHASSTQTFVALTEAGESVMFGADGAIRGREGFPGLVPIGVGCSVYLNGTWWVVNPLNGAVKGSTPAEWIPHRQWIGVATHGGGELLLASADGVLYVLNPRDRSVASSFSIPLWPSHRDGGGCAVIGAGDGWYFSYDFPSSHLTVLDSVGQRVGEFALRTVLPGVDPLNISAVAADGAFLGVGVRTGAGSHVVTLKVSIEKNGV